MSTSVTGDNNRKERCKSDYILIFSPAKDQDFFFFFLNFSYAVTGFAVWFWLKEDFSR